MSAIPLQVAETELGPLLTSALDAMRHQAELAEVDLRVDVGADVPALDVDAEKIAWAVTTLVGNALRYVRRGTRHRPGGSIVVTVERDGGGAVVRVVDDGPGIPKERVPHLFARAPGARHASALSLCLVRDVVVAHGGDVDVRSATESDHGTVVTLRLPAPARAAT